MRDYRYETYIVDRENNIIREDDNSNYGCYNNKVIQRRIKARISSKSKYKVSEYNY